MHKNSNQMKISDKEPLIKSEAAFENLQRSDTNVYCKATSPPSRIQSLLTTELINNWPLVNENFGNLSERKRKKIEHIIFLDGH